jgi:hypothetical protein
MPGRARISGTDLVGALFFSAILIEMSCPVHIFDFLSRGLFNGNYIRQAGSNFMLKYISGSVVAAG